MLNASKENYQVQLVLVLVDSWVINSLIHRSPQLRTIVTSSLITTHWHSDTVSLSLSATHNNEIRVLNYKYLVNCKRTYYDLTTKWKCTLTLLVDYKHSYVIALCKWNAATVLRKGSGECPVSTGLNRVDIRRVAPLLMDSLSSRCIQPLH